MLSLYNLLDGFKLLMCFFVFETLILVESILTFTQWAHTSWHVWIVGCRPIFLIKDLGASCWLQYIGSSCKPSPDVSMGGHKSSVLIGGNFNPVLDLADPCLEMSNRKDKHVVRGKNPWDQSWCYIAPWDIWQEDPTMTSGLLLVFWSHHLFLWAQMHWCNTEVSRAVAAHAHKF